MVSQAPRGLYIVATLNVSQRFWIVFCDGIIAAKSSEEILILLLVTVQVSALPAWSARTGWWASRCSSVVIGCCRVELKITSTVVAEFV